MPEGNNESVIGTLCEARPAADDVLKKFLRKTLINLTLYYIISRKSIHSGRMLLI